MRFGLVCQNVLAQTTQSYRNYDLSTEEKHSEVNPSSELTDWLDIIHRIVLINDIIHRIVLINKESTKNSKN